MATAKTVKSVSLATLLIFNLIAIFFTHTGLIAEQNKPTVLMGLDVIVLISAIIFCGVVGKELWGRLKMNGEKPH